MSVEPRTLIDELLAEQQRLTPVERFAQKHERGDVPAQSRYYRDLIPETKPGAGQQYAFGVDLDACTGCKACVSACHSLNGLEEEETWRSTGLLIGSGEDAYQQIVTTACHHCVEPGCLEGCPVMAYEKDEETGIVQHLDDQCIGCQYCVLKCPYDVPKYSKRLGIVRKCDMCMDRLAVGEAPACVQACPHEAIRITLVDREEVARAATPGEVMVPGAFESSYTKPTTRFTSRSAMPANARPADDADLRLEHAHWPLVWMLLFTQAGAGLFTVLALAAFGGVGPAECRSLASAGWLCVHAGLGVSVLHLGRPLGAWRFFLGLRTSWMSREILAFGLLSGAATATAIAVWVPALQEILPLLAGGTAALGLLGVFTSAMIYIDTRRPFWMATLTVPRFYGTTLLLGSTFAATVLAFVNPAIAAVPTVAALLARTALFAWEYRLFQQAKTDHKHPAHRATRTVLRYFAAMPLAMGILFGISTLAGLAAMATASPLLAVLSAVSTLGSQAIDRACFFSTCPAPRMPGGIPA
jgi:formate dehydrogenase iron-sulfur subunit